MEMRVCRKHIYLDPEMITSEIYTYNDMYNWDIKRMR